MLFHKKTAPLPEAGLFSLFRKAHVLAVLLAAGSLLFAGCDFVSKFLGLEDGSDSGPKDGAKESLWKGRGLSKMRNPCPASKKSLAFNRTERRAFIKKGGLGVNDNILRNSVPIPNENGSRCFIGCLSLSKRIQGDFPLFDFRDLPAGRRA
jgi:hypothetical protein